MKKAPTSYLVQRPHKASIALSNLLNHAIQHAALLPYMAALLLLSVAFFVGALR